MKKTSIKSKLSRVLSVLLAILLVAGLPLSTFATTDEHTYTQADLDAATVSLADAQSNETGAGKAYEDANAELTRLNTVATDAEEAVPADLQSLLAAQTAAIEGAQGTIATLEADKAAALEADPQADVSAIDASIAEQNTAIANANGETERLNGLSAAATQARENADAQQTVVNDAKTAWDEEIAAAQAKVNEITAALAATPAPTDITEYTVTFEANGTSTQVQTIDGKVPTGSIADPAAPEGQQFDGWFIGETPFVLGETEVTAATTVVAQFSDQTAEQGAVVTFSYGINSTKTKEVTATSGGVLPQDQVPTTAEANGPIDYSDARAFVGWYDGDTKVDVTTATFNENTTLTAKYENVVDISYVINTFGHFPDGSEGVIYTITTKFNPNILELNLDLFHQYMSYFEPSATNPLEYTYRRTVRTPVNSTVTIFYTVPNTNGYSTYQTSLPIKIETQGEKVMYTFTYEDMDGNTATFEAERGSSTWYASSPLASFLDPTTAASQGKEPTMSSDGERVFLGWKTNVTTNSDTMLFWSVGQMSNLAANTEDARFVPVFGYPITFEYETFSLVDGSSFIHERTGETTTETTYTGYNSQQDSLVFPVNAMPTVPSSVRENPDTGLTPYAYEWKDESGKVWTTEELSIYAGFSGPMTLTATVLERGDVEPSEYNHEYPLYQIYDGTTELAVTEDYIIRQFSTIGGADLKNALNNGTLDITLNADDVAALDAMNIVEVQRRDGSTEQITLASDLADPIPVRFSYTGETSSGKQLSGTGVVNALMMPQALSQYRADSHYVAAGDNVLLQAQPAQHETGVGLSYVNGIPVGLPVSSTLRDMYSQANFTIFPYETNQDATGQIATALTPIDSEAMMGLQPAPAGTDYYQGDHLQLTIDPPSDAKNYILLPLQSVSAFDVVDYEGFEMTQVYNGEGVTIESNDERFPERSSSLSEHTLTFLNSNTSPADVGTHEVLFKMLASGSTAASSEIGAKSVNITITQRPITISGRDLNVATPANDDYDVEQQNGDRGLVSGHTVTNVTLPVSDLSYLPATATILDADGRDVTANYNINYEPGTLVDQEDDTDDTSEPVVPPTDPTTPDVDDGTDGPITDTTPAPVAPAPVAVAPIVAPVVAPAVPAALVLDLPDAEIPLAAAAEDVEISIGDTTIPLADFGGSWSLVDLLLTVVTSLMSISLLITYFVNKKAKEEDENETEYAKANSEEEEDNTRLKRKGGFRVFSIIPMLGAIILFILTQDLTLPMTLVDTWTIFFAVIALIQTLTMILSRKKRVEDEDEEAEAQA